MAYTPNPNKYNSTPRKVFDKHVDRMEVQRGRMREQMRQDVDHLLKRIIALEVALLAQVVQLEDLAKHVQGHCYQLDEELVTEGL